MPNTVYKTESEVPSLIFPEGENQHKRLTKDFVLSVRTEGGEETTLTVASNFLGFNGCSVPVHLQWAICSRWDRKAERASLVHDYLYQIPSRRPEPFRKKSEMDRLFFDMLREDGVPKPQATLMYLAVGAAGRPRPLNIFGALPIHDGAIQEKTVLQVQDLPPTATAEPLATSREWAVKRSLNLLGIDDGDSQLVNALSRLLFDSGEEARRIDFQTGSVMELVRSVANGLGRLSESIEQVRESPVDVSEGLASELRKLAERLDALD